MLNFKRTDVGLSIWYADHIPVSDSGLHGIGAFTNTSVSSLEDKGKIKATSSSQPSGSEGGSFLLKSGTTPLPLGAIASPSKSTNGAPGSVAESEEEKAKKLLYCSLCKVAVNSLSQLEAHNTGQLPSLSSK